MQSSPAKPREGARAPITMVARYRSPSTFEYVEEDCIDVSVGGMFIRSTTPAAAGTLLKLECKSDTGVAKIRGVVRVVWLRTKEGAEGPSGMGVKFVKLEGQSRAAIEDIVRRGASADDPPAHEAEVLTAAVVPHTMTLAEAAASAEALPPPTDYTRDARNVWGWTLAGLAVFVVLVSSERFQGSSAGLGSVIVISEEAAAQAAAVHAERAVRSTPLGDLPPIPARSQGPAEPPSLPPAQLPLTAAPEPAPSETVPSSAAALALLDDSAVPAEPPAAQQARPAAQRSRTSKPQRRAAAVRVTESKPAAAPARVAPGNPMAAATACLQQGDNACVIAALLGRAKTAQEYELLIETLRAAGRSGEAQKHMATYVARFAGERQAGAYKRLLAAQAGAAAATAKAPEAASAESQEQSAPEPTAAQPKAPETGVELPSAP